MGLLPLMANHAAAQLGFPIDWSVAGPADWNTGANWSEGNVPDATFDEYARISNNGSAFVQNTPPQPGGIILGDAASTSGTLEIRTGGNLTAVADTPNNGALVVGQSGTGTLIVQTGGSLSAASISSAGTGSSITLNGTAQLTATGSANLNALTTINGQSANLSAAQALAFGGSSRLQVNIAGANAPLMKAGTGVSLGGVLEVDFGGATPAPGSSWNLFDAGAVVGQFSQIKLSSGSLGTGQRLRVVPTPDDGSMNGVYGKLQLDQLLVLEVNRDSGAMKIFNPSAATNIPIDGYSITSANDSFNTVNGVWNSLADQAVSGWIEANPKPSALNEFDTNAQTVVVGNGQLSLGTPWHPQFTALGQNLENVTFTYTNQSGEEVNGAVVYTGANTNDMTLFVDPATGEAQLRNASGFSASIEGYDILSASGALTPAGWVSLHDQPGETNWLEANPQATGLSELKTQGVEAFFGGKAFNVGQIFTPGGAQDLVFQYYAADATTPTLGRVVYQTLPPLPTGPAGDLDGDGDVDGNDFLVFQRGFPTTYNATDLANIRANFGAHSATAAAGAVPEPNCLELALLLALGSGGGWRRERFRPAT
jgi:hypothetical protein